MDQDDTIWDLGVARPKGAPGAAFELSVRVDEGERDAILSAIERVRTFSTERTFDLVLANLKTLQDVYESTFRAVTERGPNSVLWRDALTALQQALVNWLQSTRVYLDQTASRLTRSYGKSSDEIRAFDRATKAEFDNNFTYRFCYKLRDYCTHVSMPPMRVHAEAYLKVMGGQEEEFRRIRVQFDPEELLSSWDEWRAHVTHDLRGMRDPFDVLPVVEDATRCLRRVAVAALGVQSPDARAAADVILTAAARAQAGKDSEFALPALFKAVISKDGRQVRSVTPHHLDTAAAQAVLEWNPRTA